VARLINCFEVPPDRDEEFLAMFGEMNAYMAARPGFRGNRLHRSLAPDARYRFVNYVKWESPAHLRAARDDHFDRLRAAILAAGFTSTSSVYEIVQERGVTGDGPAAARR
jgi:heme-degrading monooxygenase HmoA